MTPSRPSRTGRARRLPVLVLALAFAVAGCAGGEPEARPSAPVVPAPSSSTTTAAPGPAGVGGTSTTAAAPGAFAEADVRLHVVAEVPQAVALAARAGTDDLYVAGRDGRLWRVGRVVEPSGAETWAPQPELLLDLRAEVSTDGEQGMLGLAFSADGATLYLSYTDVDGDSMLEALPIVGTAPDAGRRRLLLRVDQPFSNHNGGHVVLGPDGMLWFGLGDGGGRGDPDGHGQDPTTLLGSLLRIDPEPQPGAPYGIPADNPYADGVGGAPEVWLWGVRNPWRFAFDRATGDLWLADVGQNRWEEIDLLPADAQWGRGANLGWDRMEGLEPYDGAAEPEGHHRPVLVYGREGGRCSITGGVVYRGADVPALSGVYLYGDLCTGEIRGLQLTPDGPVDARLAPSAEPGSLVSFGEDAQGEVYVLELAGRVSRLAAGD